MKPGKPLKRTPLPPGKPLARTGLLMRSRLKPGKKGFRKYGRVYETTESRLGLFVDVVERDGGEPLGWEPGEIVDLHHVIPKRVLARIGRADLVADPANLMALGRCRHDQHETRFRPLTWEELPGCAIDFADALGLRDALVRLYPSAEEAERGR